MTPEVSPLTGPRTKIAFVTNAWIVGGGAEKAMFTLLSGLDRSSFELAVFTIFDPFGRPSYAEKAERLGVRVTRFRVDPRLNPRWILEAARFFREIRRGKFDALHCSGDMALGLLAGRLARVPVRLLTVHDESLYRRRRDRWARRVSVRWLATKVVAVSSAVAADLQNRERIAATRVEVVVNGVDDSFLESARSADADSPRRLLTVARLAPEKGVDLLLSAFALLADEIDDLQLDVVGDGPVRDQLRSRARLLGIEGGVRFHGQVERVGPFYRGAEVFVLPSRSEGLGIAAIEAMAASLPVVASAVGGLPEVVVDGETGLLVRSRAPESGGQGPDSADLAAAVAHLLQDPGLARAMGRAGRARYEERFTARAFVDRHEALYVQRQSDERAWIGRSSRRVLLLAARPHIAGSIAKIVPHQIAMLESLGCAVDVGYWGRRSDDEPAWRKPFAGAGDLLAVLRRLSSDSYDVLFVNTAHGGRAFLRDVPLVLLTRRNRARTILLLHGSRADRFAQPRSRLFKVASRFLSRWSDAILLLSSAEVSLWQALEPRGRYFRVQNPFVPGSELTAAAAARADSRGSRREEREVLFVGRLIPEKGPLDLLEAIARVVLRIPCRLVLAGSGPLEQEILSRAEALGLAHKVTLRGYLEGADLAAAYARADLFALPTYWHEGFPTVLAEAASVGLPIVTTRIRGAADVLTDGRNCLFVPSRDPAELAVRIAALLESDELADAMSLANGALVTSFQPERVAHSYAAALGVDREGARDG
jgi:glycosyltransferase involved in cell wall biosynthesis